MSAHAYEEKRRYERVRLVDVSSAVLRVGERIFKVLDLGYGGIALGLSWLPEEAIGKPLSAIPLDLSGDLYIPLLQTVRVNLRCVYCEREKSGAARIGLYFCV